MNKLLLIGNVGADPQVRSLQNGSVADFRIATTKKGFTRNDGTTIPDRTEWHTVVAFQNAQNGLVSIIQQYVHKGSKVYVEGELYYETYTGRDGVERTAAKCRIEKIELLDRPTAQNNVAQNAPAPQPQQQGGYYPPTQPIAAQQEESTDLPF